MRDNDPLGFEVRYRASRAPIPRGVLTAKGLNHEGSADGHEKFSSMALQMGPVGFGIYAFREKLSGRILHGAVVPNVRKASTIGHVYLDMVSVHGRESVYFIFSHDISNCSSQNYRRPSIRKT